MPNFKDKKTLLITGGIIALMIILWMMFGGGSAETDPSLTEIASDPVELIIGREMLLSLEKMKSVKLDTALFEDNVFKSLEDFTVEIPKQPIGRRDPFAAI